MECSETSPVYLQEGHSLGHQQHKVDVTLQVEVLQKA